MTGSRTFVSRRASTGRLITAIAAVVTGLSSIPTMAKTPEVEELAPMSPWHVDWTEKTCVMRRGFGTKDDLVVLQFEKFAPGNIFQLIITGKRFRSVIQGGRLELAYGRNSPEKLRYFFTGQAADKTPIIFIPSSFLVPFSSISEANIAAVRKIEATVETVSFAWGNKSLTLETGPLDKAFAALSTCTDDLVRLWGLDPEQQKGLSRRPAPRSNPGHWVTSQDYPKPELFSGKQGIVNFRLTVDASGKPTQCEVQRSYSDEEFDKLTCRLLMQRARFEPALDTTGRPIPSYYANTVNFYIP